MTSKTYEQALRQFKPGDRVMVDRYGFDEPGVVRGQMYGLLRVAVGGYLAGLDGAPAVLRSFDPRSVRNA